MVGWHHRLSGHESEQPAGNSEGQGSLACYNPWGRKELDMNEQLNNNKDTDHVSLTLSPSILKVSSPLAPPHSEVGPTPQDSCGFSTWSFSCCFCHPLLQTLCLPTAFPVTIPLLTTSSFSLKSITTLPFMSLPLGLPVRLPKGATILVPLVTDHDAVAQFGEVPTWGYIIKY